MSKTNPEKKTIREVLDELDREKAFTDFGRKMLEEIKDCIRNGYLEANAEDLADIAVKCGLISYVAYDPDKHGGCIEHEEELVVGDMIYWFGATGA